MKLQIAAAALLLRSLAAAAAPPPAPAPAIFAPGVISSPANDGAPTFSPDGSSLFFTRSGANGLESIILQSHVRNGAWTAPEIAPFSGQWYDSSPTWAPDGSAVIFESTRPAVGPSAPAPVHASHLWRVERRPSGWSAPVELPPAVNIGPLVYRPSLAADGTLFFISRPTPDQKFRLYCSARVDGAYQAAHALPFSDGTYFDVDPEIAPDQAFLIFASSGRPPFKDAGEHLFIVRRAGSGWGPVETLRYDGDTWPGTTVDDDPRLGPDHRTLYFSSDRSPPVRYPLTAAAADLARMGSWDNGSVNVWFLPLPGPGG